MPESPACHVSEPAADEAPVRCGHAEHPETGDGPEVRRQSCAGAEPPGMPDLSKADESRGVWHEEKKISSIEIRSVRRRDFRKGEF
jgi:hypothetical protein